MNLIEVLQEELQEVLTQELGEFSVEQVMRNVLAITDIHTNCTVVIHLCDDANLIKVFRSTTLREYGNCHRFHIAQPDFPDTMMSAIMTELH